MSKPACVIGQRRGAAGAGSRGDSESRISHESAPAKQPEGTRRTQTSLKVTTISVEGTAMWDGYIETHRDATLFHTMAWCCAVKAAFGHQDHYLIARRNDRIVGLLPLFFLPSRFAGRMLVSVPYGVGGGILADDGEASAALFAAAKETADRLRCGVIDLRSERANIPHLPTVDRYVGFRRALPDREVLAWLPRKARGAVRNARDKFGLTASFGDEHLAEVWRLYSISMRRLASLSYPLRFFERLIDHTPDRHWVSIVKRGRRTAAGLVTFLFKDRVMPYFFGSTDEARRCSAANFIYWTVMERGAAEGFGVFDFGRSRRDNRGSFDFKRFHGFTPQPLGYQRYVAPGQKAPNLSPSDPRFRLARRIWPMLPLCVTRAVGSYLARHIPG